MCALSMILLLLALGGCEEDGNDWQRLVCDVEIVNAGSPLVSAYLDAGSDNEVGTEDDFQPIDMVQVVFHARPYSSTVSIPEDSPYSWFQVESYDLVWENNPLVPVDLQPFNVYDGVVNLRVPVNEEGAASVLVAGVDMKNAPWFIDIANGFMGSFQADLHLTFYGHESGSDEEVALDAGLRVHFIGVKTGDD
jgi:hypothetical protein